jgi:hypothetical protein
METCSKGRRLQRVAARGEKTENARNVVFVRGELGSWAVWGVRVPWL